MKSQRCKKAGPKVQQEIEDETRSNDDAKTKQQKLAQLQQKLQLIEVQIAQKQSEKYQSTIKASVTGINTNHQGQSANATQVTAEKVNIIV